MNIEKRKLLKVAVIIAAILLLVPQSIKNPVEGAGPASYHHQTFWMPWGNHHHHGIDIFAKRGTPIHPACAGLVISTTDNRLGGKTVSILGLHGRIYYYAHMDEVKTHMGFLVTQNSVIGTVGDSDNAAGKPCHCHFSILTLFPRLSQWVSPGDYTMKDDAFKMFLVNPVMALDGEQLW